MKMDVKINEIEKGRRIIVRPRHGGGYEFTNRADHNLDIVDTPSGGGFWIVLIVLFLIFWRIIIGDTYNPSQAESTKQRVRQTERVATQPNLQTP